MKPLIDIIDVTNERDILTEIIDKQTLTNTTMQTQTKSTESDTYKKLFNHANKQYKNIGFIEKAFLVDNRIYAIDYVSIDGMSCIACNTAIADKVIYFKEVTQ